jgi:carboxyl-terminal processing protease
MAALGRARRFYCKLLRLNPMKKSRLVIVSVAATVLTAVPVAFAIGAHIAGPSRTDLALLDGVIQLVEHDYVHPVDSHMLTEDALKGMMSRLDPHSDYMNEQEFKESEAEITGKFGGLGIQITEDHGVLKVISPIDGTPAARAGIQPGDLIVEIDGKSTQGLSLTEIVRVLRGKPGTSVTITIARGSKMPFDVAITREIIQVPTVKSKLEPNGIGYVRVSEFGGDTSRDVKQALTTLKQQAGGELKGLVLDLRNDPGGLLSAAVAIAGNFLDGGTVVTIKGRRQGDNHVYDVPATGTLMPKTPMVVLINGASASASEIVAGALQDRHRAKIMGTQSFGKGSVQTIIPLNGHGALRLTTALYYTPSGRSIQDRGISPDIVVEAPKDVQVAGALLPRESTLHGAFQNPGSLVKTVQPGKTANVAAVKTPPSPPIKTQLIGTDKDGQLKAALDLLGGAGVTGKG